MIVIRNLNQINSSSNLLPELALTIGNFDGMHLGHAAIVNEIKTIAKEKNLSSAILTFEPHPIAFFKPDQSKSFRITSLAKKLKIFQESGIDYAIVIPFNQDTSEISAHSFIKDILVEKLNINHLAIGYDFTFGKNRQGNFDLLKNESETFNFTISELAAIKNKTQICSSSLVRKSIADGKISEANRILGHNFSISGLVNNGRKLASQIGFPTMNLIAKPNIIAPKFGVYKTKTFIPHLNKTFPSITNFGIKPTINNSESILLETHIPNFSQIIYGKKIIVEFLDFIREEKKFSSLDELKNQIKEDLKKITL